MSNLPFAGISAQVGVLTEQNYSAIGEPRMKISAENLCEMMFSQLVVVGFLFVCLFLLVCFLWKMEDEHHEVLV